MKKFLVIIMCFFAVVSLTGCRGVNEDEVISEEQIYRNFVSEWTSFQDVQVLNARVETDKDGKRILLADVKNDKYIGDISDIVISFATWDSNGKFIIIKSKNNPTNTYEEFTIDLGEDTKVKAGETWEADLGLYLDDSCEEVKFVKAAIVSYKIEEKYYENEYYIGWKDVYLGKTLTNEMLNIDKEFDPVEKLNSLNTDLKKENAYVTSSSFYKNEEEGDVFLTSNIKNNLDKSIGSIKVAFVAWDKDGKPIMIKSASGNTADSYVKEINMGETTIAKGEEFLGDTEKNVFGLRVSSEQTNINYVKAIVISYVDEDGTSWNNPYYYSWKNIFSGQVLEEYMR